MLRFTFIIIKCTAYGMIIQKRQLRRCVRIRRDTTIGPSLSYWRIHRRIYLTDTEDNNWRIYRKRKIIDGMIRITKEIYEQKYEDLKEFRLQELGVEKRNRLVLGYIMRPLFVVHFRFWTDRGILWFYNDVWYFP